MYFRGQSPRKTSWGAQSHTHCEAMVQLACTIIGLISLDTYLGECAASCASPAVLLSNLYPDALWHTTADVMTYRGWQPYCGHLITMSVWVWHSPLLWCTNSFVQYYSWMVRPNCTPIASAPPAAPIASASAAAPHLCPLQQLHPFQLLLLECVCLLSHYQCISTKVAPHYVT